MVIFTFNIFMFFVVQEEQNRGKPNWEHLNDELHVLITVEDTENRAKVKLQRAVDEIKKLLVPAVSPGQKIFIQPTMQPIGLDEQMSYIR